jgi:hypothetical protein
VLNGTAQVSFIAGWIGMLAGVGSGSAIGLFFHDNRWMGGYASFRRRLVRLGHISFFGIGFINILFALSTAALPLSETYMKLASLSLVVAAVTMPACCFLVAWRQRLRLLFPIPVIATLAGIAGALAGWLAA